MYISFKMQFKITTIINLFIVDDKSTVKNIIVSTNVALNTLLI